MTPSDIPFLSQLRTELRRAAVANTLTRARRRRFKWAWRLLPPLMLLSAGVAVAATLLSSPTPTALVAQGVSCVPGTSNRVSVFPGYEQRGSSPVVTCGRVLSVSPARLIACYNVHHGVTVYESDGRAGQCRSLGMSSLPKGYAAATARVNRLQAALNRLSKRAGCVPPQHLATASQRVLDRLGFVGWHARTSLDTGSHSTGPCGQFPPGPPHDEPDAAFALDGHNHLVEIDSGPYPRVAQVISRETPRLMPDSGRHCYSTVQLEAHIDAAFAPARIPVRFAITREARGEGFGWRRQARYDDGCTVLIALFPAPDGRTTLAELANAKGSPLSQGSAPPLVAYHSAPTR